ncbi:DUF3299 domain-containing protein [Oceaniglobus trochenteri]|uniref:DUF3299 domain-containing protein n=1 Tax=Oceaniglobus trochenteri TaxID=2763260 RepID=UPI001CFFB204|nr:DUF3299 domain-containing protein [Oceaniglobus trochenteri]
MALTATGLWAEDVVELDWPDLVPEGVTSLPPELQGLVAHKDAALASEQPHSNGVRRDWNGLTVRLSGFIIPLDYDGTGVTAFMLVPYVGACIHVPPPPANQLVLVTTERPYAAGMLFEAVTVTGMFGIASTSTQMAEVGYALSADSVVPYRGRKPTE